MKVKYLSFDGRMEETNLVLCLGFFDGMHLAHQKLIDEAISVGQANNLETGLVTFSTQVMSFIKNEQFFFLTSLETKIDIAKAKGFDYVYVLNVEPDLINQDPEEFISRFLSQANTLVVGFDFSFGKFGKGTVETLLSHPEFTTVVIPEMTDHDEKIGSTRIRELLSQGNITDANRLLGKPYALQGEVVIGKGRGKILGYPTANLDYDGYFLPKNGVYATWFEVDGQFLQSMTNIGDNPTFFGKKITVESHIFRFGADLYGKSVRIHFLAYIREEIKYTSTANLVQQMQKDELQVQHFFETGCSQ